jgi:hypothetical protein
VASGRDRRVVQEWMGVDHLIVARSHGFDIWSPDEGTLKHEAGGGYTREVVESVEPAIRVIAGPRVRLGLQYRSLAASASATDRRYSPARS